VNEKQLGQIDALLQGQDRYKLLDCEETAFLQLKGARLQVWLTCYICENDDQQSWLSNAAIMRLTGLSKHAVIDARRWLVENGWLKHTGHVAAMKYVNPSQGAYSVKVMSVDNPYKNCTGAECAPQAPQRGTKDARAEIAPPSAESAPKGSVSVSAFGSVSGSEGSTSESTCTSEASNHNDPDYRPYEQAMPVASLLPPCRPHIVSSRLDWKGHFLALLAPASQMRKLGILARERQVRSSPRVA
jgi:hypothetical protein